MPQNVQSQPTDVFDAAKQLVETLKSLDQPRQVQAIRFATEALGLPALSASQTSESQVIQAPTVSARSIDIRQFTDEKAPKSDMQFAAVVAYYYRFEAPEDKRKPSIDAATLTEAARLAHRKRPPKPNTTLNNAKAAGYLDSDGGGNFSLSTVGENLVAVTLPGDSSGTASTQRGARRNTRKRQATKSKRARTQRK